MADALITHVSDTARWVAVYRAKESKRADALFQDPLAEKLAGPRGYAIAEMAPPQMKSGWPIVMRTKVMDDLVLQAIAEGTDLVINLAAGLDTRPYRLPVPPALRWVEADLPAMIEEKEAVLCREKPRCALTRIGIDLANASMRQDFLRRVVAGSRRVLVITEGLLIYLDPPTVESFARDLLAVDHVQAWLSDLASPAVVRLVQKGFKGGLDQAPMKFAPPEGVAFFERIGWKPAAIVSLFHEAIAHRRVPFLMRFLGRLAPRPDPRNLRGPWSGVVKFVRE